MTANLWSLSVGGLNALGPQYLAVSILIFQKLALFFRSTISNKEYNDISVEHLYS